MARKLVILACLLAVSQMGCLAQPASSTDPFQDTGVTTTTGSPTTFSPATVGLGRGWVVRNAACPPVPCCHAVSARAP